MLKIRKTSILLLCIVAITSCGFKKINMLDAEGFAIQNIKIIGNKRIGHDLKNDILSYSSKKNENKLEINLEIKKGTVIKERDISSKITKNTILFKFQIVAIYTIFIHTKAVKHFSLLIVKKLYSQKCFLQNTSEICILPEKDLF